MSIPLTSCCAVPPLSGANVRGYEAELPAGTCKDGGPEKGGGRGDAINVHGMELLLRTGTACVTFLPAGQRKCRAVLMAGGSTTAVIVMRRISAAGGRAVISVTVHGYVPASLGVRLDGGRTVKSQSMDAGGQACRSYLRRRD
jgi:hypothetical protein